MNLNLTCPINQLSYGIVSINLLNGLIANNCDISLFPIGPVQCLGEDVSVVEKAIKRAETFRSGYTSLRIYHQFDLAHHVGKGEHIGFPIFELDTFTSREQSHLLCQDKIIVASKWARDIIGGCLQHSCPHIEVVPFAVDTSIFKFTHQQRGSINGSISATRFLNCGKWEVRKGHPELVEAFNKAFEKKDDVQLTMLCHNPFLTEEENRSWGRLYKNSKLGDKIEVVHTRLPNQHSVAHLMNLMDCGVFPSKAEGWNLELSEMMAMNKAVIATNYSGHTEFVNKDNCRLIDINEMETAVDSLPGVQPAKFFHGQGRWASLGTSQMDQLVTHLRAVHKEKQETGKTENPAGYTHFQNYTWEKAAKKIIEALE